MQPKNRTNKTLLASALVIGLGNAFHASGDILPVSADAVSDVTIAQHGSLGGSSVSFGNQIKLNPAAGDVCTLIGASNAHEAELGVNVDGDDGTNDATSKITATADISDGANPYAPGDIDENSTGCLGDDLTGGASGSVMVLEVTGVAGTTVSVDIPNISGTGWEYRAGVQSCVVDFNGDATASADVCRDFDGITSRTGVGLANAVATEFENGADIEDNTGQTHILLAGQLVFDGTALTAGAVAENITVTITYE